MAVRTKQLFGPVAVAVGNAIVYTCPADETTIIKALTITKAAGIVGATVSWGIDGTAQANFVLTEVLTNASRGTYHDVWLVLQPGQTLRVVTDAAVTVSGHGTQLEGVAD